MTNPELRKLYNRLYHVAKASVKGEKVLCPCGCMVEFRKRTDSHVFAHREGGVCKTRYYNRIRSKSNYAYTPKMLKTRQGIWRYLSKRGFKL